MRQVGFIDGLASILSRKGVRADLDDGVLVNTIGVLEKWHLHVRLILCLFLYNYHYA